MSIPLTSRHKKHNFIRSNPIKHLHTRSINSAVQTNPFSLHKVNQVTPTPSHITNYLPPIRQLLFLLIIKQQMNTSDVFRHIYSHQPTRFCFQTPCKMQMRGNFFPFPRTVGFSATWRTLIIFHSRHFPNRNHNVTEHHKGSLSTGRRRRRRPRNRKSAIAFELSIHSSSTKVNTTGVISIILPVLHPRWHGWVMVVFTVRGDRGGEGGAVGLLPQVLLKQIIRIDGKRDEEVATGNKS